MTILVIILAVLSSFLTNLESKILQSDFVATVQEGGNAPMNYPGSITIKGESFVLSMSDIEAAYDGKTMYMYSEETDELTLTKPTEEELIENNPLLFAKTMVDQCVVTEKEGTNGETVITLVPNDKSLGINRFVLYIRTSDLMPLRLEMKEGQTVSTLKLINPKFISKQPKFTIEPNETTFVNDLRF